MNAFKLKIILCTLIFHILTIFLLVAFQQTEYFDDVSFIGTIAILTPMLTTLLRYAIDFFTEVDNSSSSDNVSKTYKLIVLFLVVLHGMILITLIIWHALFPITIAAYLRNLGIIQTLLSIFIIEVYKKIFTI